MDAFSEILSGVRLSGAVFFAAEFSAPWGFTMPASSIMTDRLAPGARARQRRTDSRNGRPSRALIPDLADLCE